MSARWVGCSGGCCVGVHVVQRGERAAICTDFVGAMRELLNESISHILRALFAGWPLSSAASATGRVNPPPPPPIPLRRLACPPSALPYPSRRGRPQQRPPPRRTLPARPRGAAPPLPRRRGITSNVARCGAGRLAAQSGTSSWWLKLRERHARGGPSPCKAKVSEAQTEGVPISQQLRCLRLISTSDCA